ncbi:hypothetical protein Tco_1379546, partial [Tanacetum coccineum]
MLHVLTMGQTSVPFIHRMSVVSVLALMETMLYILHRHCSLPPEETGCTLPLEETCCSLTSCSLPSEETSCSLPPEETGCSLPPKEIGCSLPNEETGCFLPPEETLLLKLLAEGFILRGLVWRRVSSGGARPKLLVSNCFDRWRSRSEIVVGLSRMEFLGSLVWSRKGYLIRNQRVSHPESKAISSGVEPDQRNLIRLLDQREFDQFLPTNLFRHSLDFTLFSLWLRKICINLRHHLPDPNFRMINLLARDTAIGTLRVLGFPFPHSSLRLNIEPTLEGVKSGLKLWKVKYFLIDRKAIPFHMPWRHPCSCITDRVPTSFNQNHIDRLKAHIVKIRDILEGVLVRCEVSRVLCNSMCDPVMRHSGNTGTTIPRASLEEISITRPDCKVVPKFDNTAKRKASTGPEISTNATKKTISNQRDCLEFATEDIESLNDVSQCENINIIPLQTFDLSIGLDVIYPLILLLDKEVEPQCNLFGGVRRTTRAGFRVSHGISKDAYPRAQEATPALLMLRPWMLMLMLMGFLVM